MKLYYSFEYITLHIQLDSNTLLKTEFTSNYTTTIVQYLTASLQKAHNQTTH